MILLNILFGIIIVLLGGLYAFFKYKFRYWSKTNIKHTNPKFPCGDLSGMNTSISMGEIISNIYNNFPNEKFVGLWFFHQPTLLVRDPDVIKNLFVKDFMTFHDRGIDLNEKDDPLSANLFSLSGSRWRNIRVRLTPTLTSGKMKLMFPIFVECSKQFASVLSGPAEREEVIDVKEYAARFTTDIIALSAFGINSNSMHTPDNEFRRYGKRFLEPTFLELCSQIFLSLAPNVAKYFGAVMVPRDATAFFLNLFKDSIDQRKKNNIRRNDFLDLLMQLMDKGKLDDVDYEDPALKEFKTFSFEEAAAQAFGFFVGGFETSSTTMQFSLYELALYPELQEKARDEINRVLKKYNGQLTYECVNEMEYLSRIIDETLRMFPPLPNLQRKCNKDYPVPNTDVVIPKDMMVLIDVFGMQRDPVHYPNPERFDPDRFTKEEKAARHHYAYLPFGEGPRNCIGSRFGLMQTKVGLITLLSNYEFLICNETLVPIVLDPNAFILSIKGGAKLKIRKVK